ncbi:MAG: hypothetical protein IJD75_05120 [Clostridia bacterium]|nr:hypothetical protein [Clostridia bacterium]
MGTILTVVLLLFVVLSVLWSVTVRKLAKTRIKSISRILCVVLAFVGTLIVKDTITSQDFLTGTVFPALEGVLPEAVMGIIKGSAVLLEVAVGMPAAFLAPLVFVLLYIVLSLVAGVVCLILYAAVGAASKSKKSSDSDEDEDEDEVFEIEEDEYEYDDDEDEDEDGKPVAKKKKKATKVNTGSGVPYEKARAFAWSFVSAVIVLVVVLLPVAFYSEVATDVVDVVVEADVLDGEAGQMVSKISKEYLEPLAESPAVQMFRVFGGDAMVDSVTSFNFKGDTMYLANEVEALVDLVGNVMPLVNAGGLENFGADEAEKIVAIADAFNESKFLTVIGSEAIYLLTDDMVSGEKPMPMADNEMFGSLIGKTITILHDDAKNTTQFTKDVRTVAEMASALIKGGVLANMNDTDNLFEGLANGSAITDTIIALGKNSSMKCLVPEVTNIGIEAIGSFVEIKGDANEAYNTLLDTIAADLNGVKGLDDEFKLVTLSSNLSSAFDHAGVVVDKKVIDLYAIAMVEDVVKTADGEITAADVQGFFADFANTKKASAAATLAKMLNSISQLNSDSASFGADVTAILQAGAVKMLGSNTHAFYETIVNTKIKKAISAETITNTEALASVETFEKVTLLVFMDELVIDVNEASAKITDSTINQEAKAIGGIFAKAGSLLNEVSGDEINIGTMAESVGAVLNSLQDSVCVGKDRTAKLFIAIVQSGIVRDAANMDIATATELGTKGSTGESVDYAKTFKTISNAMDVLQNMNSSTEEGMTTEALTTVLKDLNPQTAGMMESYITEDRLAEDYGLNEEQSGTAAPIISDVFGYWNDPEVNMTEEESAKEAEALNDVMNLVTSASDKANSGESSKSVFGGEDSVLGKSADETVETFMSSEALKHSLNKNSENGTLEEDPFGMGDMLVNDENNAETEDLKNAMSNYYANSEDKENDKESLTNLGKLFGFTTEDMDEILGE